MRRPSRPTSRGWPASRRRRPRQPRAFARRSARRNRCRAVARSTEAEGLAGAVATVKRVVVWQTSHTPVPGRLGLAKLRQRGHPGCELDRVAQPPVAAAFRRSPCRQVRDAPHSASLHGDVRLAEIRGAQSERDSPRGVAIVHCAVATPGRVGDLPGQSHSGTARPHCANPGSRSSWQD